MKKRYEKNNTEDKQSGTIFASIAELNKECDELMNTIDWEWNAADISRSIHSRFTRDARRFSFTFAILDWKALAPIAAAVLIFGIWLGYLLFHTAPGKSLYQPQTPAQQASLARLETTLAEREIANYFEEAHLVLTDLMRQCDADGAAVYTDRLNRSQVKLLLNRSKYFSRELDNPRLLISKGLMKKIEWLLYEILTLDDSISCSQLLQLQDYIRRERLLLKIRLMEKDITEV
ncbi:MAG: hypothetical protein L0Y73_08220 [Candidatus Aminicenantes bacterium]|nr:hypothetical protein [Candidatus Aminicenantes bacterium]